MVEERVAFGDSAVPKWSKQGARRQRVCGCSGRKRGPGRVAHDQHRKNAQQIIPLANVDFRRG